MRPGFGGGRCGGAAPAQGRAEGPTAKMTNERMEACGECETRALAAVTLMNRAVVYILRKQDSVEQGPGLVQVVDGADEGEVIAVFKLGIATGNDKLAGAADGQDQDVTRQDDVA